MTVKQMQEEILRIKKENDTAILAHAYQSHDIWEVADYVGDSFGLALNAAKSKAKTVIMCGVRFMAETVKILSPEKTVILANENAGCPMAEQMDKELISDLKQDYPDYSVVCYINTTARLKTVCDVCVTSSSAENIIKKIQNDKILFIPDRNLGGYIAKKLPQKTFKLVSGGCPTHIRITRDDVEKARRTCPDAEILVHPECLEKVAERADFVGSTTQIISYASKSDKKKFFIGTENSIVGHLQLSCPEKLFYPLSKDCVCNNMKLTTLGDVYGCIKNGASEITLDESVRAKAKRCIDEMLLLGV